MGDGPVRARSVFSRAHTAQLDAVLGVAFANSSTAMCVIDMSGRMVAVNDSLCELLRHDKSDLLGVDWTRLTHPDELTADSAFLEQGFGGRANPIEKRVERGDGTHVWCRTTASPFALESGDLLLVEVFDLTSEQAVGQRIHTTEERMKLTVAAAQDAFVGMDARGLITEWNDAAETMFGWSADDAVGRELVTTIVPPRQRAAHAEGLARYLATGEGPVLDKKVEVQALRRDGSELLVELTIWPIATPSGLEFNAFLRDVSERRRFQEELRRLAVAATTDQGTGLKNRRGFFALAQHELNLAHRLSHPLTLIFFDLDRLKHINDTFGHLEGDRAIADTAHLLSSAFRESDLVARLGGDEFCVLALGPPAAFAQTMRRFEDALDEHNRTAGRRYALSLSYGVAFFEPASDPVSLDELVSTADASMYEAKQKRRSA